MQRITRAEVRSLEDYEMAREGFRQHVRGVRLHSVRGGLMEWQRYPQ